MAPQCFVCNSIFKGWPINQILLLIQQLWKQNNRDKTVIVPQSLYQRYCLFFVLCYKLSIPFFFTRALLLLPKSPNMPWRVHCSSARAKNKKRQNEKKKDTIVSKKGKSTGLETYF